MKIIPLIISSRKQACYFIEFLRFA